MLSIIFQFLSEQWFPVVFFLVSLGISCWFWKNPNDYEIKNKRCFKSPDEEEIYLTGTNLNGWIVQKTLVSNIEKQLPYSFQVARRNNPDVMVAPQNLDDLRKLNYEKC